MAAQAAPLGSEGQRPPLPWGHRRPGSAPRLPLGPEETRGTGVRVTHRGRWPSPADYQLPSPPACPAFSFRARPASRPPEARARQGVLQGGRAGPWAQPLLQAPPPTGDETGPGPSTYNILPGCRLKGPCPPAFSMGRSPLLASWVGSSCTPGPAAYDVEDCYSSRFPSAPGVAIQGVRRPKRHNTGPFCAL
ncbi:TPA: hypothetical protein BOS_12227 [Bos taurus]|nr:TPA: hypothetical protein BOS_12227 [Bos taurus]